MQLEDAQKLAQEIVEQIHPYCKRVEVAGSIRRKKSEVRDVDIVLIPKPSLWRRIIATLQRKMDTKIMKRGESIVQLTIKDVNIDLYVANEHGCTFLIFSKEAQFYRICFLFSR